MVHRSERHRSASASIAYAIETNDFEKRVRGRFNDTGFGGWYSTISEHLECE